MSDREVLKTRIRMLAGLPPTSPNDAQLNAIIARILRIVGTRTPALADWRNAAKELVPGSGTHLYAGEDLSSLNQLLLKIKATSPQASTAKPGVGKGNSSGK